MLYSRDLVLFHIGRLARVPCVVLASTLFTVKRSRLNIHCWIFLSVLLVTLYNRRA